MNIGEKIKKAIETSNITQEQVAAHADMSLANLYKIYKRDSVESRYLIKIAEILDKPISFFLYDGVEDKRATNSFQFNNQDSKDMTNNVAAGNMDIKSKVGDTSEIMTLKMEIIRLQGKLEAAETEIKSLKEFNEYLKTNK